MAERLSTGFADALNVTGSVKAIMANSIIHIFSGVQPASADDLEVGTLLMRLTVGGLAFTPGVATNGLNMGVSAGGVLAKLTTEAWQGTGLVAAGTGTAAGWFRWYNNAVVAGASTTAIRMDGAIGTSTAFEIQMSNITLVDTGPATVNTFTYTTTKL